MEWLKDFFHFSRSERNGLLVLFGLCLVLFVAPAFVRLLLPERHTDFSALKRQLEQMKTKATETPAASLPLFKFDPNVASKEDLLALGLPEYTASTILKYREKGGFFLRPEDLAKIYNLRPEDFERLRPYVEISAQSSKANTEKTTETNPAKAPIETPITYFEFDPNRVSEAALKKLGLSPKVVTTLMNFRAKGGRFYKKEDLRKIYGLTEPTYQKLAPFIVLTPETDREVLSKNERSAEKNEEIVTVDINKADQETWRQLKGVGPVLSNRIVKFREKLGGFIAVEQVGDTYGLPDSTFQKIIPQLRPSPLFRKIRINSASEEELTDHPYISFRQASAIVNFRSMNGPLTGPDDFRKIRALTPEDAAKILPYLSFD